MSDTTTADEKHALDFDNNLCIGTTEGLRVLYMQVDCLPNQTFLSPLIINEGGNVGELLANQFINAIEINETTKNG